MRFVFNIVCCLIFHETCVYADENVDPFKRAVNRTFIGFEKENNQQWHQSFHFIQGADTQFGMIEAYVQNKTNGNWTEDIELTRAAIKQWNQMTPKPKFVVICGDLVNDYPGSEPRRADQLRDFKNVFEKLDRDIPLVLLGGNHDFLDSPTYETIKAYKADFGDDYFAFYVNGCMFIVINVQFYKNHDNVKDLYEEQEKWIDERLDEAKSSSYKHIIVFQHIPWFLHNISEPLDEIFNIPIETRDKMVKKFQKAGVRAIFAGHYHRNAGGRYEDMEMIVTSAIGAQSLTGPNAKSGYRVVYVNETEIQHKYVDIITSNAYSGFKITLLSIITVVCFGLIIEIIMN